MATPNVAWERGYVQLYTGDGKGKTTAALGLALRAAGASLPVCIVQFMKAMACSEVEALRRFADLVTLHRTGVPGFVRGEPSADDRAAAQDGLTHARTALFSGRYRVVILDEAAVAAHFGLITVDDLLDLIRRKPDPVELVITGRRADPRLVEHADLVTEMRAVKHYYGTLGVRARVGIEK